MKGLYNNQGRKSGGYKRPVVDIPLLGGGKKNLPILSIQCFENRHNECNGLSTLGSFPAYKCECKHHMSHNGGYKS